MNPAPIYLDHNATAPLLPEAAEAMRQAWQTAYANPASQHGPGRASRQLLQAAREQTIRLLGGDPAGMRPDRLVFTSGGTESNTLAVQGMLAASEKKRLVISAIEHPSIERTAQRLEAQGVQIDRLGVSEEGVVRVDELREILELAADEVGLVSIMLASNETGVLQPVAELAKLCQSAGVPLHTDAVQAVGKHPVDFRQLGVSAMSFTAHKFHGPLGVGGLMLAPGVAIEPLMQGGHQQQSLRPGTEAAPLAVGLLTAIQAAYRDLPARMDHLAKLRDRLEQGLVNSWPGAVVVGQAAERLPQATCIAFHGGDRQALVMAYDMVGVACSTGSACASGSSEPSAALVAANLPEELIHSAVRFAVGALTTEAEIDEAIARIRAVNGRLVATA